jgi:hypothetical protein
MAMEFLGARIQLNPRPARQSVVALEVAMLGHCPGRVRIERLLALADALEEMRLLGFGPRIDALNEQTTDLYHLPIPIRSLAEFDDIFPDARSESTLYSSLLAGDAAWLPQAVADFFGNHGEKLWVVQVSEQEHVQGFLPAFDAPLYDTENLRGIASVLILNSVGLVAMPDLERIQIAPQLPDVPRLRLADPEPRFIPCTASVDDGHRERRHSKEMPGTDTPMRFVSLLQKILSFTKRHRPDMQCLFTLPLSYSKTSDSPSADEEALLELERVRQQSGAHLLRQVQLLYPYMRSPGNSLYSPTGLISGLIARSARRRGIWRSVAGIGLETDGQPYPPTTIAQTITLREAPGVGVIQQRSGVIALDDERIVVPALYRTDYAPGVYSERLRGMRSGEVVRFIGFLLRQLKALGERIIFNVGYQDPRPRLVLEKFFIGLFNNGALRGSLPEQAYSIRQSVSQEAVVAFDIEIAPAFPIDKIVLTFINRDGSWFTEVNNA